ncbi:MAG: hypothetical protein Q7S22_07515 [Candidatus Micrarchaeota archaeon]|nr:hypothetical protein [Candidatus Micrarchaeota archaeon]
MTTMTRKQTGNDTTRLSRIASVAPLVEAPAPSKLKTLKNSRSSKETLKQIVDAWEVFVAKKYEFTPNSSDAELAIVGLTYSAKDVERFSLELRKFQRVKRGYLTVNTSQIGIFLSALINHGTDSDYVIHVQGLYGPTHLCMFNTKNVTVNGDVGLFFGWAMKSGNVTVNGNASWCLAQSLKGGSILVTGNAGKEAAEYMKGGTLIVRGNLDPHNDMGSYSSGGIVLVEGSKCGWKARHAKITLYHRGQLVPDSK